MVEDIKESTAFKNIGIDVDAVANAKVAENNQLIPDGGVQDSAPQTLEIASEEKPAPQEEQAPLQVAEQPSAPPVDLEGLKKEIYAKTTAQLVDLAAQFTQYAKTTDAKIRSLESQLAEAKQAPVAEAPKQKPSLNSVMQEEFADAPEQTREVKETKPAPKNKEDEYNSDDVAVDKIFDFSNTKGQGSPKPNR